MSRPTVTEARELIQTAGRMSKGAALPKAARTEATVVGRSWMEAVLSPETMTASSQPTPNCPSSPVFTERMASASWS